MTHREAEVALVAAHRKANPESRAPGIIIYHKNTARVRQQRCILCGKIGPSWCGDWPKTKRAERWAREHVDAHVFIKMAEHSVAAPT